MPPVLNSSQIGRSSRLSKFDDDPTNQETKHRQDDAQTKRPLCKLYSKKVLPSWYSRYVDILPVDEQIEYQPYMEIQRREQEVAVQEVFGEDLNDYDDPRIRLRKIASATRRLEMMNTGKSGPPARFGHLSDKHKASEEQILAENSSGFPFGLSQNAKTRISPLVRYIRRLRIIKRVKLINELRGRPLDYESAIWQRLKSPKIVHALRALGRKNRQMRMRKRFQDLGQKIIFLNRVKKMCESLNETEKTFIDVKVQATGKLASTEPEKHELPQDVRFVLTKTWNSRTEEEVTMATKVLRRARCFSRLPLHVQKRFASVAWYMKLPPDTMIIRQGQLGQEMYFLISGKVNVAEMVSDPLEDDALFRLLRTYNSDGMFGAEALNQPGCLREYSAITVETTVVLSVNIHELQRMLLTPTKNEPAPKHIMFIGKLEFMKQFPKLILTDEAFKNIFLLYYSPGELITKSVKDSGFVFVVLYGSCRAIKEMVPAHYSKLPAIEKTNMISNKNAKNLQPMAGGDKLLHNSFKELSINQQRKKPLHVAAPDCFNRRRASHIVQTISTKYDRTEGVERGNHEMAMRKQSMMIPRKSMMKRMTLAVQGNEDDSSILSSHGEEEGHTNLPVLNAAHRYGNQSMAARNQSMAVGNQSMAPQIQFMTPRNQSMAPRNQSMAPRNQSMAPRNQSMAPRNQSMAPRNQSMAPRNTIKGGHRGMSVRFPTQVGTMVPDDHDSIIRIREQHEFEEKVFEDMDFREPEKKITGSIFRSRKSTITKLRPQAFSRWKLQKILNKGDQIGNDWINYYDGKFFPPKEDSSLVSDGCEVVIIRRSCLSSNMGNPAP